jgi:hypothetical protein
VEDNVVRVVVGAVEGEGSVMQSHSVFNIEREENNALRALLNNVLNSLAIVVCGREGENL